MFVQQDFLNAFFGSTPEVVVISTTTVSATSADISNAIPPPTSVLSTDTSSERVIIPDPVALSSTEIPLTSDAHNYLREPSVSTEQSLESSVPPEPLALPEQVASETLISPGIGELLDRLSRTIMELRRSGEIEYEEMYNQNDIMAHQAQNTESIE
jgi:hypothetical protein